MAELDLHAGRGAPPIVLELAQLPGQMCGCEPTNLCDTCRGGRFDNLRGTAACRGEAWADRVARAVPHSRPWPAWNDKVAAIARRQVQAMGRAMVVGSLVIDGFGRLCPFSVLYDVRLHDRFGHRFAKLSGSGTCSGWPVGDFASRSH